jgi:hypothetical protein
VGARCSFKADLAVISGTSAPRRKFAATVNAFGTPSDERVLQTPNWSQPGPTSVRPG